jgi:NAD(P)-dependent dehydrogenase (short-subunit alcohol dehydrogenase family)
MNLKDKVVVVTGAGSGIGRETCLTCAEYGAVVAALDINLAQAEVTADAIKKNGGKAIAVICDVTDHESVKAALAAVEAEYGRIDCLSNNAGVCINSKFVDVTEADLMKTININIKGIFYMAVEAAKIMMKYGKGRIVNISSISGIRGENSGGIYAMSKAAALSMTKVMALEWASHGINVVSICPGNIETEMTVTATRERSKARGITMDEYYNEMLGNVPIGRLGKPRELADVVAFLFDDRSSYIVGSNIVVSGGRTAN